MVKGDKKCVEAFYDNFLEHQNVEKKIITIRNNYFITKEMVYCSKMLI